MSATNVTRDLLAGLVTKSTSCNTNQLEEIEKLAKEELPPKGTKTSGVFVCKNDSHQKEIYFMSAQAFRKHVKEKHTDLKYSLVQGAKNNFDQKVIFSNTGKDVHRTQGGWQSIVPLKTVRRGHITLRKNYKNTREMFMVSRSLLLHNWLFFHVIYVCMYDSNMSMVCMYVCMYDSTNYMKSVYGSYYNHTWIIHMYIWLPF